MSFIKLVFTDNIISGNPTFSKKGIIPNYHPFIQLSKVNNSKNIGNYLLFEYE